MPASSPAVPASWGSWTQWSGCSVSCGGGRQSRSRSCVGGNTCTGQNAQFRDCNQLDCPQRKHCSKMTPPINSAIAVYASSTGIECFSFFHALQLPAGESGGAGQTAVPLAREAPALAADSARMATTALGQTLRQSSATMPSPAPLNVRARYIYCMHYPII